MGPQYLIDTNVVIDFFNSRLPINGQKLLTQITPAISVVTHIELFSSSRMPTAEVQQLQEFVKVAIVYDTLSAEIVKQAIAIRQKYRVKTPDAIIAATALAYGLDLITRNISDFEVIDGLQVVNPHVL